MGAICAHLQGTFEFAINTDPTVLGSAASFELLLLQAFVSAQTPDGDGAMCCYSVLSCPVLLPFAWAAKLTYEESSSGRFDVNTTLVPAGFPSLHYT